ncbi:hypothetical protein [Maribacter halichondriae]|uniref:hypothetical protein n=1 Tax=Maribacter halichondriae TaxID=2980554 RepID=UPI0023589546|nr:hypothetical protein [Maribacter sp. Hal144]
MKSLFPLSVLILFYFVGCQKENKKNDFSIHVSFSDSASSEAKDGRLLLMLSNNDAAEPRFQINDGLNTQLIFGMNVDGMAAGETKTFNDEIFGFPYPNLAEVPPENTMFKRYYMCTRHSIFQQGRQSNFPWIMVRVNSGIVLLEICTVNLLKSR